MAELKRRGDPESFVFPDAKGKFIDPDYFDASIFAPIAKRAKLNVRFHDLRHFFASMLIAQGESAKYVCDQMGHSSIQVTFDTYGHLFAQAKKGSVAAAGKGHVRWTKTGHGLAWCRLEQEAEKAARAKVTELATVGAGKDHLRGCGRSGSRRWVAWTGPGPHA